MVVFNTAARRGPDETWIVPIHGRIWKPATGRTARAALRIALRTGFGVAPDAFNRDVFDERCAFLLGDNRADRQVVVSVCGVSRAMPPSGRDGQFRDSIVLPASLVAAHAQYGRLTVAASLEGAETPVETGWSILVPPHGVSVISDIDDTVKVSHVGDRRRMMALTFLEAFGAIDGIAARYRDWAAQGAAFHFISSSPWPLYEPITAFLAAAGFPAATCALKNVGLKDRSIRHFLSKSTKTKPPAIEALLDAFPERRFVLVGDSAENDAEIYVDTARRHPGRISHILIRQVSARRRSSTRLPGAFAGPGLEDTSCQIFSEASELPERIV
ncbi:MAG: phosphatase domain-containing protein [Hyphomicrobiaceae bacterium]|nr:phosphatase domain-containing protein [Hyphomicrobiaceae bacterium]